MVFERGDEVAEAVAPPVDVSLDTPNCAVCLHRMEVEETATGTPFWACASCGATRVA